MAIVTLAIKCIEVPNKVYVYSTEPPSYNLLINQGTSDYQRDKKLADHEVLRGSWENYLGAK